MSRTSVKLHRCITLLAVIPFLMLESNANAVELSVLSPHAMKPALNDLIPQFEQSSGHRVVISYATASNLVKEIEGGKTADLAILSPEQIEQLEEDGKIVEDSSLPIAKLEIGIVVRKDTKRPDLSTVHRLKQTLIAAESIASGDPKVSASGEYFVNLIERLQIADAVMPKIKSFPSGTAAIDAVANGEADMGVGMISVAKRGNTEIAGVFPAQARKSKSYAVGILTSSEQTPAAKALASFISSRKSSTILKSNGFEGP
jgi:molybdate transport system substrate-binding protein